MIEIKALFIEPERQHHITASCIASTMTAVKSGDKYSWVFIEADGSSDDIYTKKFLYNLIKEKGLPVIIKKIFKDVYAFNKTEWKNGFEILEQVKRGEDPPSLNFIK